MPDKNCSASFTAINPTNPPSVGTIGPSPYLCHWNELVLFPGEQPVFNFYEAGLGLIKEYYVYRGGKLVQLDPNKNSHIVVPMAPETKEDLPSIKEYLFWFCQGYMNAHITYVGYRDQPGVVGWLVEVTYVHNNARFEEI